MGKTGSVSSPGHDENRADDPAVRSRGFYRQLGRTPTGDAAGAKFPPFGSSEPPTSGRTKHRRLRHARHALR
ncbi:hypothetical protein BCEP4_2000009 [Burkholderia cepacia]|nr:hypothetical protein BCEP4_2000009 [Burkholderia cepacia]